MDETRQTKPALTVKLDSFRELLSILEAVDTSFLFTVSAEPQPVRPISVGQPGCIRLPVTGPDIPAPPSEPVELDLSVLSTHLEEYFSWFGEVERVYLLGTSIAVFRMKHTFSVTHVLKYSQHEVSIPQVLISPSSGPPSILSAISTQRVTAQFTVHAFNNDSLSLNAILSILKHVDPATVVMVRRVNRLGFNGSGVVKKYFERYGKVLKVFMLPLRSRKKSLSLPSKTGFVVMESPTCCTDIIRTTEHAIVPGLSVSVGKFTHRGLISSGKVQY